MIGTILNAKVIGKTVSKNDPLIQSGVVVELPDGMKGTLHVKRMNGYTPEERAVTLSKLTEGTTVEVEVVSDTTVDGEPGFRVSQWAVLRRARKAAAEALLASQEVKAGEVVRLEDTYAIVRFSLISETPEGCGQGVLHVSRVAGASDEERSDNFGNITLGQSVKVQVAEVLEVHGRMRMRLGQVVA